MPRRRSTLRPFAARSAITASATTPIAPSAAERTSTRSSTRADSCTRSAASSPRRAARIADRPSPRSRGSRAGTGRSPNALAVARTSAGSSGAAASNSTGSSSRRSDAAKANAAQLAANKLGATFALTPRAARPREQGGRERDSCHGRVVRGRALVVDGTDGESWHGGRADERGATLRARGSRACWCVQEARVLETALAAMALS